MVAYYKVIKSREGVIAGTRSASARMSGDRAGSIGALAPPGQVLRRSSIAGSGSAKRTGRPRCARPISIPSTAAFRRNWVISCRCRNRRHLVTAFLRPSRMGIGFGQGKRRADGHWRETLMLDKTDDISVGRRQLAGAIRGSAGASPTTVCWTRCFIRDSYWRDVLALSWNIQTLNGADAILNELRTLARSRRAARLCDRSRPPGAAQGDARRHPCDRGDLQVRDRRRARQRHPPPDPGCRRRQYAEGLDAPDRARRTQGL